MVDALGTPIDGAGPINTKERRRVELKVDSDVGFGLFLVSWLLVRPGAPSSVLYLLDLGWC